MSDVRPVHIRHGSNSGQGLTRREGVLKVTGAARYAADNHPAGMLHAVVAVSSIARGRVTALDVAAARGHAGVVEVMSPGNAPKLAGDPDRPDVPLAFKLDLLQNDRVRYAGQPIAACLKPSRAEAEDLADQVGVELDELPAVVDCVEAMKSGSPRLVDTWPDHARRSQRSYSAQAAGVPLPAAAPAAAWR